MNRGEGKWKWLLGIAILAGALFIVVKFGPPYFNMLCLKQRMETNFRQYAVMGEEQMIETIINLARQDCKISKLKFENFTIDPNIDVGYESWIKCEYTEIIILPGNNIYKWKMKPTVKIKVPSPM